MYQKLEMLLEFDEAKDKELEYKDAFNDANLLKNEMMMTN